MKIAVEDLEIGMQVGPYGEVYDIRIYDTFIVVEFIRDDTIHDGIYGRYQEIMWL